MLKLLLNKYELSLMLILPLHPTLKGGLYNIFDSNRYCQMQFLPSTLSEFLRNIVNKS